MSYQVIARKYRPQRFSDVVGQEHVTTTLANAISQNRVAHAFLFCGPRGTGKTTIARIFAKCLNSSDGPRVDFADDDPHCVEIAEGRSLDVLEIDGASNNGVEQVRELRETVKYAPATSRFKIYIIDEVHMLSTAAFNALLKTLEEPPAHVKFMFATTEPEKVLPTILSRCQRFDLRRIPVALIVKHIASIAAQEKVQVDDAALHAIARGADGCMRDAESTLDQLISFCGDGIEESDVLSMFGLTARGQLIELAQAILEGKAQDTLRQLNALATQGKELGRLLSDLLNHFRNLLIYHVSKGDLQLLEVSEAEAEALKQQSRLADAATLNRIMEIFSDAELRFRDAASRKILLEVTMMKAIEARELVSLDSVLQTLQGLRSGDSVPPNKRAASTSTPPSAAESRQAPRPRTIAAPAPAPDAPPASTSAPNAPGDLESLWSQVLEATARASRFTHTYLVQAHPVSLDNKVLTIGFDPEFEDQMGLADNAKTHDLLQTKLRELGHPGTQVKFIKASAPKGTVRRETTGPTESAPVSSERNFPRPKSDEAPPARASKRPASPPKPPVFNKEEFKNDPLIKQALEMFKGQIVDVRS